MKPATMLYAGLGLIGVAAAVAVPVALQRNGSQSMPLWTAAISPGPLSAAHDFLGSKCESCHTPARGVEAASCLTCHATAAPDLMTKPSTAFHANVGECAGCHVEHGGRDRRPINMDHAVLAKAGHARAAEAAPRAGDAAGLRHDIARLKAFLSESMADARGGPTTPRPMNKAPMAALDCRACHANRDPHATLFGRECQTCHNVDTWRIASFRHPSPRSQDCVQCHQAPPSHYMMHFQMMDQTVTGQGSARVEQCFLCHQTDSWNNIRGLGWFKHH